MNHKTYGIIAAFAGLAAVAVLLIFPAVAQIMRPIQLDPRPAAAEEQIIHPGVQGPTSFKHNGAIVSSAMSLGKNEYKVGERIDFRPALINTGNETITISHADPGFVVDVYGPLGIPVWSYQYPMLDVAHIKELEVAVPYFWSEDLMKERYDIRLYIPGDYTIVSHTEFLIEEPGSSTLEEGLVYSKPVTIRIVP
jgi:hypothetical protein